MIRGSIAVNIEESQLVGVEATADAEPEVDDQAEDPDPRVERGVNSSLFIEGEDGVAPCPREDVCPHEVQALELVEERLDQGHRGAETQEVYGRSDHIGEEIPHA